jgi:outer membrane receptor for ferrienterochelin and colicin
MIKPLSITLAIAAAFPQFAAAQEEDLARVVVTGSNIRTAQKEGASAVQVLSAKDLAATGKTNVADILRSISANSGNSYNEQFTGSFSAGTAGISLRGLGQKNTLILVNGTRLQLRHGAEPAGHFCGLEQPADGRRAAHRSAEGRRILGLWFGRRGRRGQHHPVQGIHRHRSERPSG